jgi:transposase-like protein
MPRTHRPYPPEFRAEAVRLARGSDRSIPALAADLGVSSEALRHWISVTISASRADSAHWERENDDRSN